MNEESSEEMLQLDKSSSEMLAILAHELRNPLSVLSMGLQLLELDPDSERQAVVVSMRRQLDYMNRLVKDLLESSQISTGKLHLRREPVELGAIMANVVSNAEGKLTQRSQQLDVRLPDDSITVFADTFWITQAIRNLIDNASKYSDGGTRIELAVEHAGDAVQIRVRDEGAGIDAQDLPQVFDEYAQSHRTLDRSDGGFGIGLALVRRIVAMHDGSVTAQSDGAGKGSEFVVCLPLNGHAEISRSDAASS